MAATTPPVPNPTPSLTPSSAPPLINTMIIRIGDPFIPPQHHGFFPTGPRSDHNPFVPSPTTISASALVEHRPPPEPPPQVMWQTPKGSLGPFLSSNQRQSDFASPPSVLGPERPPRKPSDAGMVSYLASLALAAASAGFFLCRRDFHICNGILHLWCLMERPKRDGHLENIWCALDHMRLIQISASSPRFNFLPNKGSIETFRRPLVVEMCLQKPKMICNWIDKKTVDSHFLVITDHVRKLRDRQIGSRNGLSHVPMAPQQSLCIDYVFDALSIKVYSVMWMGNAPTLFLQPVCTVVYGVN